MLQGGSNQDLSLDFETVMPKAQVRLCQPPHAVSQPKKQQEIFASSRASEKLVAPRRQLDVSKNESEQKVDLRHSIFSGVKHLYSVSETAHKARLVWFWLATGRIRAINADPWPRAQEMILLTNISSAKPAGVELSFATLWWSVRIEFDWFSGLMALLCSLDELNHSVGEVL
jgi:hypothetical protein